MLINKDEKLRWTHKETDAGFFFRRVTTQMVRTVQAAHTEKGVTDTEAVVAELLEWAILGWFGFIDHNGKPVEYRSEYLPSVPDPIKSAFIGELYSLDPIIAELGN